MRTIFRCGEFESRSTARATKKPERVKPRATKIPKIKAAVGRDRESFIERKSFLISFR